ncbi:DUF4342 domain-containing protein [Nonomuraea sp. NPDC049649]|uniref:DUF4342 domain-containing protein n=1 Tax=Nonomuraea sp. NPDC049649 TaxID=3155776 RepID=UPI003421CD53
MTVTEERVRGGELTGRIKKLVHEGNVRRIMVRDREGRTVLQVPVSVGVGALAFAPVVTVLGAMGALAADWTIRIEGSGEQA